MPVTPNSSIVAPVVSLDQAELIPRPPEWQPTGPTASPHASSRSERFLGLLDQLGDQLNELGRTVAALADECAPDDQPATAEPGGQVDLTRWDHLVENTSKDDPYGADADLRAPAQTWNGAPER